MARWRSERLWLWSLLLAAAALRAAWLAAVPTEPVSDFLWYHERASEIARGLGYGMSDGPTAFRPPGYPAFLAALYAVFGPRVAVGKAANLVLSLAAVYLTHWSARPLLGARVALLAAGLVAASLRQISYTSVLAAEPLFTCLLLLVLGTWARRPAGSRRDALLGAGAAALSLVKAHALLFPLLFGCWERARGGRWRAAARTVLVSAAAMALCLAPWTYRNWRALGAFVPVSTNGGLVLFANNNPRATGVWMDVFYPGSPLARYLRPGGGGTFDEVAVDRAGRRLALRWIRAHPGRFARLGVERLRVTFLTTYDLAWSLGYWEGGRRAPARWAALAMERSRQRYEVYLTLALAWPLLAVARGRRRLGRTGVALSALALSLAYFAAVHFVFEGQPRYNAPLLPLWYMAAAAGACELWDALRATRPPAALR